MKEKWVLCPICLNKTRTKIRNDTVAIRFPVFCPVCKNNFVMDFENGKAFFSEDCELNINGRARRLTQS